LVTKFLRFVAEGLQCCLGVKQRGLGRKTSCSLLGDCSHLGRQTECETVPLTPENFISKNRVDGLVFLRAPVAIMATYDACGWKVPPHCVRGHFFGRRTGL